MLRSVLVAVLLVGLTGATAVEAAGKRAVASSQRFNIICTANHLVGNERYVGSDHDPIPTRMRVEYAVDLKAERFQEREPHYISTPGPIVEVGDRDVILVRNSVEFYAFRRRDLFLVQVYSGPEGDVRVMAGSCQRRPFTPFEKPGRR
jgi:hypothetical protein